MTVRTDPQVPDRVNTARQAESAIVWCVPSTTPKARALGAELRQARERTNLSKRELARRLEINHSNLSRIESGERPPRPEVVASILTALGINGAAQESILELSRDTGGSYWISVGMPEQELQLAALLDFERTAQHITDVSPLLIPGLLQTSDYVRAIMTTAGRPAHDVHTRATLRTGRREILTRKKPVDFTSFIGEPALHQCIVEGEAMAEQLRHVLTFAALDHVTVQVIPGETAWHPGLEGAFSLLDFTAADPIVHLETRRSGLFLGEENDVAAYRAAVDKVWEVAMSPEESARLIAEVADGTESKA